jgi:hypothetical protein
MFRDLDLFPFSGERKETPTLLSHLERVDPTELISPSLHMRRETDPVSETMCFLVFRIPDDGRSPQTQYFWVLYTIRQKPLESTRHNGFFRSLLIEYRWHGILLSVYVFFEMLFCLLSILLDAILLRYCESSLQTTLYYCYTSYEIPPMKTIYYIYFVHR